MLHRNYRQADEVPPAEGTTRLPIFAGGDGVSGSSRSTSESKNSAAHVNNRFPGRLTQSQFHEPAFKIRFDFNQCG
jgi:hypothetical protein